MTDQHPIDRRPARQRIEPFGDLRLIAAAATSAHPAHAIDGSDCARDALLHRLRPMDLQRFLTTKDYRTKTGQPLTLKTSLQMANPICTTEGSTGVDTLRQYNEAQRSPLERYWVEERLFSICVERLKKNEGDPEKVDAVLGDDANLLGYLLYDADRLQFSGGPVQETEQEYVAGIKKNKMLHGRPLLDTVNDIIEAMKGGQWGEICQKWVGFLTEETCDPDRLRS